jgi:hypothetical protein
MALHLNGQRLATIAYDYGLVLVTDAGWHLTIETDLTLTEPGHDDLTTAAGEADGVVDRLEHAVGQAISSFVISKQGGLTFAIAGLVVKVEPSEEYEAWNIVGPGQQRVVSMPGGEVVESA